jgi:hypothetical protein
MKKHKANIIYKTNMLTKEDKKKVRDFIEPYNTEGLTIIFSERWDERSMTHEGKYKWYALRNNLLGCYWKIQSGYAYGKCGVKNINYPLMVIKVNERTYTQKGYNWWNTFLHEFGHYIDDKTNGGLQKHKRKEAFAITFASIQSGS